MLFFIELRYRFYYPIFPFFFIRFSFFFSFDSFLYLLASPLLSSPSFHFIHTDPTEAFFIQFKLSFLGSFITIIPFFIYQIRLFIKPGLYKNEKKYINKLIRISFLFSSICIFISFFFILPLFRSYFSTYDSSFGLHLYFEPKLDTYISFVPNSIFPSFSFSLFPYFIFIFYYLGYYTYSGLIYYRYLYNIITILISSIISPDFFFQFIIFFSFFFFYEFIILFSFFMSMKQN